MSYLTKSDWFIFASIALLIKFMWPVFNLFQKDLWYKKGEAKKVQVTERLKRVKSLWG